MRQHPSRRYIRLHPQAQANSEASLAAGRAGMEGAPSSAQTSEGIAGVEPGARGHWERKWRKGGDNEGWEQVWTTLSPDDPRLPGRQNVSPSEEVSDFPPQHQQPLQEQQILDAGSSQSQGPVDGDGSAFPHQQPPPEARVWPSINQQPTGWEVANATTAPPKSTSGGGLSPGCLHFSVGVSFLAVATGGSNGAVVAWDPHLHS